MSQFLFENRSVVAGKFSNILEPFHPANEDLDILSHVLEF